MPRDPGSRLANGAVLSQLLVSDHAIKDQERIETTAIGRIGPPTEVSPPGVGMYPQTWKRVSVGNPLGTLGAENCIEILLAGVEVASDLDSGIQSGISL
jgi:hypothetical protein